MKQSAAKTLGVAALGAAFAAAAAGSASAATPAASPAMLPDAGGLGSVTKMLSVEKLTSGVPGGLPQGENALGSASKPGNPVGGLLGGLPVNGLDKGGVPLNGLPLGG